MDLLTEVIALAKAKKFVGVAIVEHSGKYVAICLSQNGMFSDLRNWDAQPTIEQALIDLRDKLHAIP